MVDVFNGVSGFTHPTAWEGRDLGTVGDARAMLLYADRSYHWHENVADELFCVLGGSVDLDVRDAAGERRVTLQTGDIALIRKGEHHVAHPHGEARILIVAGG